MQEKNSNDDKALQTTNASILLLKESVLCNMQLEHLQTCPLAQLILLGYEDTRKVCRKGDIHGRVTEGHMPGNEMCYYWMQEGHM